jgi:hypothetical protein
MNATAQSIIPAAYRDRVTVADDDTAPGALRITFADIVHTEEQRATMRSTERTRAANAERSRVYTAVAKEGRTMRYKVAGALRANGYDVTDAEGDRYPLETIGDQEATTVAPLLAVPVAFGEATSDAGKAWESGVHRGWDHANFVEAYGEEHDTRHPEVPGGYEEHAGAFEQGWREGIKRYRAGRWQDGTKQDD